jgi:uncharacterized protein YbjT (DUF2867 family)
MSESPAGRRVLLAGGGGGLLGRAVLEELQTNWTIRSIHRHPVDRERALGVEVVPFDLERPVDWSVVLDGVDAVVNLAWYRWSSGPRFRALGEGLVRLVEASRDRRLPFVQVSVPPGPEHLERTLPYFTEKRRVDTALRARGPPFAILRPTMMFGRGDVLLGVMLRSIRSYPVFPLFGTGTYRVSPVAASDVARLVSRALDAPCNTTQDIGGPRTYRYRDVTDRMYQLLGRAPRYWRLSRRSSIRLARLMQALGSRKIYAYEVDWLLTDTLALPPVDPTPGALRPIEPFLREEAERLTGRPAPDLGAIVPAPSEP